MQDPCRTILIVEDDPDIRESFRDVLEDDGYTVETARNGREGLDKLGSAQAPCLILLDLLMPVMNGIEFLAALSRSGNIASPPVVIVSAHNHLKEKTEGAVAFLKKPVELDTLLRTVRQYCGPSAVAQP